MAGSTDWKINNATTPIVALAQAIRVDRRQPRASSTPAPRLPMMLAALAMALYRPACANVRPSCSINKTGRNVNSAKNIRL
ncbi:hypothetical protein D3C86_919910 [compost metagenome]